VALEGNTGGEVARFRLVGGAVNRRWAGEKREQASTVENAFNVSPRFHLTGRNKRNFQVLVTKQEKNQQTGERGGESAGVNASRG